MLLPLSRLFKREYKTLNRIEVSKSRLISNYQYLSSLSPKLEVVPVVKSNAYGHGIVEVCKILDSEGAPFFCVDSLFEAYQLHKAHIRTPILIMGYTDPENFKVRKLPFSFAVCDMETIKALHKYQGGAKVHIKVDTGMHRLGVAVSELASFLKEVKKYPRIQIEGLMSHFASAYGMDDKNCLSQIKEFSEAKKIVGDMRTALRWYHLSATTGFLDPLIRQKIAQVSNMVRIGRGVYGMPQVGINSRFKPTLKLFSRIAGIKSVDSGEKIGYDGTYTVPKDSVIGILPIGYNDGVDRRLSNKGTVQIRGKFCPIIGRISMNMTIVDLGNIKNPYLGQEVLVFSDNPKDANSIDSSAKICQTLSLDLLVHLDSFTKRVVV